VDARNSKMSKSSSGRTKTIAQAEMRAINRSAVLDYLRLKKAASRTEIAQELQFSKPTAMRIIDELMEEGFVSATGKMPGERGRSRELLGLQVESNLVIGVDVGGSHIRCALANIGGDILFEVRHDQAWSRPDANFKTLTTSIDEILAQPIPEDARLLGMAIGIPGILDHQTGQAKLVPSLNWSDFPVLSKLEKNYDLPMIVENDVNLAVLGEYWFGAGIGFDDLIMISVGTGIGAGIILDGKIHRGSHDSSGEIGYFLPGIQFLEKTYPGFGALESMASGKGISERAERKHRVSGLTLPEKGIGAAAVFEAARSGEGWAGDIVSETIDYLSQAIGNVAVLLDPEIIILGGGVANSVDLLIEPIIERLAGVIPRVPLIKGSQLKDRAVILGSVVRVFQKITDYTVVRFG
jgi:glucokinase